MIIHWLPTPRNFGATPAGPVVTARALHAGAEALGVAFTLDADGVTLGGVRFGSLADADVHLEQVAQAMGELAALRAAEEAAESRAVQERRAAAIVAEADRAGSGLRPWRPKPVVLPPELLDI